MGLLKKIARGAKKVVRKVVPKELSGIMTAAAPFVAPVSLPAAAALSIAGQLRTGQGRINPILTGASLLPGLKFSGSAQGLARFVPRGFAGGPGGQDLISARQLFFGGPGMRESGVFGTLGDKAEGILFGTPEAGAFDREAGEFVIERGAKRGILGTGGKFSIGEGSLIRKNDGTLRMTEQEYIVAKEFMELELRNYNLNPQVFGEDIVDAISGDVSPQEFSERLQAGYQNIVQNIPQVKQVYLREFNLDLNEESIFGMFISPRLSTAVLDNQIRQSQILAEAETALGTRALTVQVARGLQQQGLTQAQARRGFQGAAALLPGLSQGAERFGRGDITATEYVEATELGDQGVAERIRRIESQITSASSAQAGAARTRTGEVVGLEEI